MPPRKVAAYLLDSCTQPVLQVERLSKLIETDVDEVKEDIRVVVINCSSTVDARLLRLYEQIEITLNQITGSPQYIAPYKASVCESLGAACMSGCSCERGRRGTRGNCAKGMAVHVWSTLLAGHSAVTMQARPAWLRLLSL